MPKPIADPETATSNLARWAFGLSALSTLVYFSTSIGIRNFVAFLIEGSVRLFKLLGWTA